MKHEFEPNELEETIKTQWVTEEGIEVTSTNGRSLKNANFQHLSYYGKNQTLDVFIKFGRITKYQVCDYDGNTIACGLGGKNGTLAQVVMEFLENQ